MRRFTTLILMNQTLRGVGGHARLYSSMPASKQRWTCSLYAVSYATFGIT